MAKRSLRSRSVHRLIGLRAMRARRSIAACSRDCPKAACPYMLHLESGKGRRVGGGPISRRWGVETGGRGSSRATIHRRGDGFHGVPCGAQPLAAPPALPLHRRRGVAGLACSCFSPLSSLRGVKDSRQLTGIHPSGPLRNLQKSCRALPDSCYSGHATGLGNGLLMVSSRVYCRIGRDDARRRSTEGTTSKGGT